METPPTRTGTTYGVPARRKEISAKLSEAYAQDMLDQREFETRLELCEAATTMEELDGLVADFGAPVPTPSDPRALAAADRHFSLLGDQSHVLIPGGPEVFQAFSVLGDVRVDVRAFRGSGRTLEVQVSSLLGDAKIFVPPGTKVVRRAGSVLGDVHVRMAKEPGSAKKFFSRLFGRSDAPPASPFAPDGPPPTVVITGWRLLGDLIVEEDRP